MPKPNKPAAKTRESGGGRHRSALVQLMDYVVQETAAAAVRRQRLLQWQAALKRATGLSGPARAAVDEVLKGIDDALADDPGQQGIKN